MRTFYEWQRRDRQVLMDEQGIPIGGKFSFDNENRRKLPAQIHPPSLPTKSALSAIEQSVALTIDTLFPDHPGATQTFWLPTTRSEALSWLSDFVAQRLHNFGLYEDALASHSTFVFHSVLSPLLNAGLLLPDEVLQSVLVTTQVLMVACHCFYCSSLSDSPILLCVDLALLFALFARSQMSLLAKLLPLSLADMPFLLFRG